MTLHIVREGWADIGLGVMNEEDATVAQAVEKCLPEVAAAIDIIVPRLLAGGRVIYTGAGTSGR